MGVPEVSEPTGDCLLVCSHFLIRKTGINLANDLNRSWIHKGSALAAFFFLFLWETVTATGPVLMKTKGHLHC